MTNRTTRPIHSEDRAELAGILRRVSERQRKSGESYEVATIWLMTELRKCGWELNAPKPFVDWGCVG